jgi:hypothetical protein
MKLTPIYREQVIGLDFPSNRLQSAVIVVAADGTFLSDR